MQPKISLIEILLLACVALSCEVGSETPPGHYEAMTYQLKAGRSSKDYLSVNRKVEIFLKDQPGFIRRDLGQLNDSVWVDVLTWRSRTDFETAYAKSAEVNSIQQMSQMIDEKSYHVFSFDPIDN